MEYKWIRPNSTNGKRVDVLAKRTGLPAFVISLLASRGYKTKSAIHSFLHPSLSTIRHDIHLPADKNILGIKNTCRIIKQAINNHEKIQLYDDYDTDGITSASIMYLLIHHYLHYDNVSYYIPDRFRDGYGPNLAEYKRLYKKGMKLLITTDNGITGVKQIAWLRKHDVKVIITDHHEWPTNSEGNIIKKRVPNANAICMANCPAHRFHFDDFCGAGIAFMISCYMLKKVPTKMLDLACLGTIADSVSLTQENRIIVKYGLNVIHHDKRKGVRALAGEADVQLDTLTSNDLSFSLIPRLNAIGRMSNANMAVELLTTDNADKAVAIAQTIEQFNRERQKITRNVAKEAIAQAELPENQRRNTLVLYNKNWFPGIVGIVGSRIVEKFYKPTLVIGHLKSKPANIYNGSGRSIPEFNLFDGMQPMQQHMKSKDNVMKSFGGHPMACGFTVTKDNIKRLSNGLEKASYKQHLSGVVPLINPDAMLSAKDISKDTLHDLGILEPFGVDNALPQFDVCLPQIYDIKQMGSDGSHLSFTLGPSYRSVHVVAFGMGNKAPRLVNNPFNIELVGTMNINHYKGHSYLQFMAKHLRYYMPKPTRAECGVVYKYLMMHRSLHFGDYSRGLLKPLSSYLGISANKIGVIIKLFNSLNLLHVEHNNIEINPRPKPCKLSDSKIYQKLV